VLQFGFYYMGEILRTRSEHLLIPNIRLKSLKKNLSYGRAKRYEIFTLSDLEVQVLVGVAVSTA
jgi:hypothetical protein